MPLKLEHRLGVRAPAEAIWALLADIDAWPTWNPLYTKASGVLRMGSTLDLEVSLPGQGPRPIRPVIADWVPNEQIHWRLSMLSGLVKSTRYLEIEELAPGSCIFSNGEIFAGLLGASVARRLAGPIRAGFRAMGEALKDRAETAAV
ncbi:MAG TPA: SRPBCC domain-containing protein [Caulobacteraceae bacterium]|jgi:hypothetical protein|nr:SRPBCC domain-containing protein [Caulobacteraceae bacterium]